MLPIIAGISYEINRLIGKSNSAFAYYLSYPGLFLQKNCHSKRTRWGSNRNSLIALEAVITDNKEEDLWK